LFERFCYPPARQPHAFVDSFAVQRPRQYHSGVSAFTAGGHDHYVRRRPRDVVIPVVVDLRRDAYNTAVCDPLARDPRLRMSRGERTGGCELDRARPFPEFPWRCTPLRKRVTMHG
jgi:hypothetical protein